MIHSVLSRKHNLNISDVFAFLCHMSYGWRVADIQIPLTAVCPNAPTSVSIRLDPDDFTGQWKRTAS